MGLRPLQQGLGRVAGIAFTVAALCMTLLAPAQADVEPIMQMGINLPGGDIRSLALSAPDPGLCRQACDQEGQCRGWTFVKPGVQGPQAMCWLKNVLNPGGPDDRTISGIKNGAGGPAPGFARIEADMRLGWDYGGADLQSFALASGDPGLCQAACDANGACRAWTAMKPGVQGPPICWLKSSVPVGSANINVVSGLSHRPGPPPPGAGAATPGWGVWASASGGRWDDPCAIQYNAAQLAGNRYDGDRGYRRVRERATQREADLDIDQFGRFSRDQPDGVVKMRSCEAVRLADLSGTWRSSNGATWSFTQTGANVSWLRSYANEGGTGTINGNTITGTWRGPTGERPVTGGFRIDAGGRGSRIDWSNGEVWTR